MKLIGNLQRRVVRAGRASVYSPLGTEIARKLMASSPSGMARRIIESKGLEGTVRRVASESLPEGMYFAKLTINKWERHRGKPFRLLQGTSVVYGNEIEPPARGFPLEYRNIVVTSDDASKFHLDIDAPYDLKIGRGAFTTPQQLKYDEQYGVQQHGDVFYSLRGNTTNPSKIIVTFPGFGPSTSRISYAVSYLKAITDADLKDTLMVCFQDRYLAAGSYMMVDSGGRPLHGRVRGVIEGLRSKYDVDSAHMLFFGASKGGSIAIHYAQDFPDAQLLLAVPQMNLPYYFNKPFFRDNLFRNRALRDVVQPEVLLRRYFEEGRKIDYFYTNSDELSNCSLIELVNDVPNLTKYRVDGNHSAVARAALPSMLGILRRFLHGPNEQTFTCENVRSFTQEDHVLAQIRVDVEASQLQGANWFLEGSLGSTRFLQLLTEHSYRFVKYTSDSQWLNAAYDPIGTVSAVTALEATGARWTGQLPEPLTNESAPGWRRAASWTALQLETDLPQEYVVLDGDHLARYRYRSAAVEPDGDTVEVHFVSDIDLPMDNLPSQKGCGRTSRLVVVEPLDGWVRVDLLALRFVIASAAERLSVVIHGAHSAEVTSQLTRVDWENKRIVVLDDDGHDSHGGVEADQEVLSHA